MKNIISVIIPIYNVEDYLSNCLDSVIQQTYKAIEIILVDDGSTDKCPEICEKYKSLDSRVIVIHKKNGGLSDARNRGIEICRGDFIAVVDSDDAIAPNYIERLYGLITQDNGHDMAVVQKRDLSEDGILSPPLKNKKDFVIEGNEKCMSHFLTSIDFSTVAWAKLYKRTLFDEVRYPVGKYHEDVFTTYRLVAQCNSIAVSSDALYYYRQRSDSIMNQQFKAKHLDAIEGKLLQLDFINKYYPSLLPYAKYDVIYAANHCLLRLAKSEFINEKHLAVISKQYREIGLRAVWGQRSAKSKIFAFAAWLNAGRFAKVLNYLFSK